jgi:two-component system response regulator HupR/HoxA
VSGRLEEHPGLARAAGGGTLFLDEIGELAPSTQTKLVRFLDRREVRPVGSTCIYPVDVRILCATNSNLLSAVNQGTFRRDLYYRLRVLSLCVPALRERPEDIPPLARHFLAAACRRLGKRLGPVEDEALENLRRHPWPGNVRELANEMDRVALMTPEGEPVTAGRLTRHLARELQVAGRAPSTLRQRSRDLERGALVETLEQHGWNVSATARALGMSRVGLAKKLTLLKIRRPERPG